MQRSPKPGIVNLLFGLLGAFCAWAGLIQLAGLPDPVFGSKENPKSAAGIVVGGLFFVAVAAARWVKHSKNDGDG